MSDSVLIILILCTTYVLSMIINRWHSAPKRHDGTQQKGGVKY